MTQPPDNKQINSKSLLRFFQSRIEAIESGALRSYRNALSAWTTFSADRTAQPSLLDDRLIADWITNLYMRGLTYKTSLHYLNILSALYTAAAKEGLTTFSNTFKSIKEKMVGIGEARWDGGIKADHFDNILKISQTASLRTGETALATDILLFSLLNGALPLYDVATIRTEQTENFDGESLEIVRRNSDPRRKYLFNLHQTALTPRQLQRKVTGMLLQLLKPTLPEAASTVNDLLSGYWAYAALRCGATPGETLAILGATPHSLPTLLLGKPEEITTDRKAELIRTVANTLTVNPVGWYAMRIRPGVKVTEIEERLDTLDSRLHRPQLFYPHEEIARRTGKKLEFKKRPVIKDVLFFRSRLTEILPLFARIGDLAWCYTTTGRPGAPYAMIPQGAFNRFQEAIGQFTPDYEVAPIGTLELREGDRVEVLGGLLNGQEFDLKKVDSRHAANSIYRLHFDAANGIEWRVSLDSRQLRRSHPAM